MGPARLAVTLGWALALAAAPAGQVVLEPAVLVDTAPDETALPLVAGDFDGDGSPDVAVGAGGFFGGPLRVLLNDGAGAFTSVDPGLLVSATALSAADLDLDGQLDLLAGGDLLFGRGDGSFDPPVSVVGGGSISASGHFNGDGLPDLAVVVPQCCFVPDADLLVFRGHGDRTFSLIETKPTFLTVNALAAVDLDGDGTDDLLSMASQGSLELRRYLGHGDGTLGPGLDIAVPSTLRLQLATGDLDEDGNLDVVVVKRQAPVLGPDGLELLFGLGDGSFAPALTFATSFTPSGLALSDLDLDGHLDLGLFASDTDGLHVWRGLGTGGFVPDVVLSNVRASDKGPAWADFDGDGFDDVLTPRAYDALASEAHVDLVRNHSYAPGSPYADLGGELAGTPGFPVLLGEGPLLEGTPFGWNLLGALPGADAYLVLGLGVLAAPFKGGTLQPTPDVVLGPFPADAQGRVLLEGTWPMLNGGYDLLLQWWVQDAGGPVGFAASAGLVASVPM